jgi:cysteinyl-tRNA synthetase
MSMRLLGLTLDIHGGGLDLQFPHHENELAQSESYTGQPFSRYWMHNGLMKIRSQSRKIKSQEEAAVEGSDAPQKMSKSLGNEIVVTEVFKKHDPETLRLLLLATHYRSPIEYSEDRLAEMRRSLDNFYRFFERYQRITGADFYSLAAPTKQGSVEGLSPEVVRLREQFLEAMMDDFNTGGALGALNELLTALNRFADAQKLEYPNPNPAAVDEFKRGVMVLRELGQILGLFRERPAGARASSTWAAAGESTAAGVAGGDQLVNGLMQLLIDLRNEARKSKNFALGDQIRKRLTELGVTLEDRPGGTGWRVG